MSCIESLQAYGLRALGIGERLLPKSDITFCDQVVLIGSGMIWNVYFAVFAIITGFCFATVLALAKGSSSRWISGSARGFIYLFRGTPLFLQFFFTYELFVQLPKMGFEIDIGFAVLAPETRWLTKAWLGALLVLFFNTSAYSAEIFHGALRAVPKGDLEAADAMGLTGWRRFRRITWPTMLRLAWPGYTNEVIFVYLGTSLVFLSSFGAWRQQGDAFYYANYFAQNTFNPFVAYPLVAAYFITGTICLILLCGAINKRLNRHLAPEERPPLKLRMSFIR